MAFFEQAAPTRSANRLGQCGEDIAAHVLQRDGLSMMHRNWRHGRLGEIDAVAFDSQTCTLVFVEVKTRRGTSYGSPLEAMTPKKQEQLTMLAEAYVQAHPDIVYEAIRFDVVGITFEGKRKPAHIEHLRNAF